MKRLFCAFLLIVACPGVHAQLSLTPPEGYTPQVGTLVRMLDDLKSRVGGLVQNLNEEQTDFLMDDKANRIGALIMHLAATEFYYQKYTFENRDLTREEMDRWGVALDLGDDAREQLKGKPISYYLKIWDEVRANTKELLKSKDDAWLAIVSDGGRMTNHWAWFHVMEHQSNHMGQIALIRKRF